LATGASRARLIEALNAAGPVPKEKVADVQAALQRLRVPADDVLGIALQVANPAMSWLAVLVAAPGVTASHVLAFAGKNKIDIETLSEPIIRQLRAHLGGDVFGDDDVMADDNDHRIAVLEAALAEVRIELERLREPRRSGSMHQTHSCPVCGATRLLHFRKIQEMTRNGMVDLALQKEHSVWWGLRESAAALEAYACRNCRLIEWHAISLDDVNPDGKDVVEIEGGERPVDPAPYR
jgi:hypothetical protein